MSNINSALDPEMKKQLKIFAFSTIVSLVTIILPITLEFLIKLTFPEFNDLSTLNKITYPITAALSSMYVTWRVISESSSLKRDLSLKDETIKKLEAAHEKKREEHNKLIINGMLKIISKTTSETTKQSLCALLEKISSNQLINCSLTLAVELIENDGNVNQESILNQKTTQKPTSINRRDDIDRRDYIELKDIDNTVNY